MNCETGFRIASVPGRGLSVGFMRIRGELAIGTNLRVTDLYAVGSFDHDHDAVMRIGEEAPGGGSILLVGISVPCSNTARRHLGLSLSLIHI